YAVYSDGTKVLALPLDQPDSNSTQIAQFDHPPWEVHVLDDDLNLLVQEGVSTEPGVRSSADPMRIWWVDGKTKQKLLVRGPEKDINLAERPVSPDRRYIVMSQWQEDPDKKERTKRMFLCERETGKSVVCQFNAKDLSAVGWQQTKSGWQVVAMTNRWKFE